MNRTFVRSLATCCVLATTGCGVTDLVPGELSEAEARQLATAMLFATFDATSVLPPRPVGVPESTTGVLGWAADFEAEVRCPSGGRVGVAMSLGVVQDAGSGVARADYDLSQLPVECAVDTESGRLFTYWGAPGITAEVEVAHGIDGRVQWRGSAEGAIDWVTDVRQGSCAFELTFSAEGTRADGPVELSGTVCGYEV